LKRAIAKVLLAAGAAGLLPALTLGLLTALSPAWLPFFTSVAQFFVAPAHAQSPEELKAIRQRIEALKKEIGEIEGARSEAADALKVSESAVSEATRELQALQGRQRETQATLQTLGKESRGVQSNIKAQQKALGALLREQVLRGDTNYLKAVFSGDNPSRVSRELAYLGYAARAEARFIDQLRGNVQRLKDLADSAQRTTVELSDIAQKQEAERANLLAQSNERKRVYEQLAVQISAQRKEVKTLEANEKRLTALIDRLARMARERLDARPPPPRRGDRPSEPAPKGGGLRPDEMAPLDKTGEDGSLFAKLKGKLRLPARGELVTRFGSPQAEGGPSSKGLFIRAESGQEVKSVAEGRVVFADWMRGFGNLLIIDHGGQYLSIYGHGEALLKQVGDAVGLGETVARTGSTGGRADSGLYFELRHQGKAFDPLRWVR
jgi:murein hydrolase activator